MKKLLILFIFCFQIQAQELDSGVDIAFLNLTGYSTFNIFLIDVDNPDSEPVQFSDNFDFGICIENTDGSDEAFAACEALDNPPYLGIWQIEVEEDAFYFENLKTGVSYPLFDCQFHSFQCNDYVVSADGRWLAFLSNDGLMLADLAQFGEAEPVEIVDAEAHISIFFWLGEQLLFWHEGYYLYDVETALFYPLETVLDRDSLSIIIEDAEGLINPPEPAEVVEPPAEIRGFASEWDWRSDGALLYGHDNLILLWDGENSEDLLSIAGEYDEESQSGGWYLQALALSKDETAFIAGFWEYGAYHQPNHYWYYHLETGEYYEVFSGDWAAWLR